MTCKAAANEPCRLDDTELERIKSETQMVFQNGINSDLREQRFEVRQNSDGTLVITVSQMYEYVPVGYQYLKRLSVITGSDKINIGSQSAYSGCETCDYGSSYIVEFHVTL